MPSNLRIHIAPVGFEHKRVTEPLIRLQADKVYLISYTKNDKAKNYFSRITKELDNKYKHIQIKKVFLNIWNFFDCIEEFRKIIQNEVGNHIYINVSTGTKITAMAGMLSCELWNASPYYANATKPRNTEQIGNIVDLPVYKINKPKEISMKILNVLQSNGGVMRKSKMINQFEEMKIIRNTDEEGKELQGPAKHSQLRALLNPLEKDWKFVKVEARGRRSEVSITDQGKTALRIFSC